MTQADRIRQFVMYNYIEPARQAGQKHVTVRAGDVNNVMVSKRLLPASRIPNVCNALSGKRFQELADVELIDRSGHPESTTTTFKYLIRQSLYARSVKSASPRKLESGTAPRLPEPKTAKSRDKIEGKRHFEIHIEPIVLEWSYWHSWEEVERDARQYGVVVPNKEAGVYEVKLADERKLLMIGRTNDLRMRIKQGLVRGKVPHSVGERIRADMKEGNVRASDIGIRWAVTDRPAAVAEELHKRYKALFGELPKYNMRG